MTIPSGCEVTITNCSGSAQLIIFNGANITAAACITCAYGAKLTLGGADGSPLAIRASHTTTAGALPNSKVLVKDMIVDVRCEEAELQATHALQRGKGLHRAALPGRRRLPTAGLFARSRSRTRPCKTTYHTNGSSPTRECTPSC